MPPFLVAVAGMALLTVMDALVKALSGAYPTFQLVFMRFAFTAVLVGVCAALLRAGWPARDRLKAHLLRAVLMVVTTSSFFHALGRLPLAEVFALSFTSPLLIALFGALLLRERVHASTALALAAGFAGMLIIVLGSTRGGGATREWSALAAAMLSPVTYALSVVLLRAQSAKEPLTIIVTVQAALVALLLSPVVALNFAVPGARDWLGFLLIGAFGAAGYLAFASGLKHMSAARFGMVEYTGLIWAALIGYAFFHEVPHVSTVLGALLIIAGCLAVLRARDAGAA